VRQDLGPDEFAITGTSLDMLPDRISYAFSLTGPSAACSSDATALHAAVTALEHGDCDQAIVGASSFLGSAVASAGFARLGVISPDGACRSFDATADGYLRAEGVFAYLLKPLAAAERDGDRILAVVAGTAVNAAGAADGAGGSGRAITAPTKHAQAALMRAACARAGLSPGDVDYIEAHAAGIPAGDRVEGNAIGEVFGGEHRAVPLRMASVKSNVGHMEGAAFACALLKVLLMFEHRTYAPVSGHFAVPSPDIDFTGLRVQTECEPFGAGPVTVGINSFGLGGTNGHCLLTEYRQDRAPAYSRPAAPDAGYLIPLSARNPQALTQTAAALRDLVTNQAEPDLDLYTLAGNLSRRRTHFAARAAFAAASLPQLAERLDAFTKDPSPAGLAPEGTGPPRILMVFAGQGTQWAGCGRALYDTEPVFRRAVDAVDAAWRELAGFSLRDACFTASQEDLDEVQLAQPAVFLIEVALAELLKTWGVYPDGVVGHSAGEVAAAYAAGIHSLAEATRLVFHRAVLQQRAAGSGRLLAVSLDRAGAEELLAALGDSDLGIACENAPASTVIGGPGPAVAAAAGLLGQRRVPHRLIRGNIAFHSRALDVVEADLRAALAFLDGRPFHAEIPFVSSVTGELAEDLDAAYWWGNVRRPVRFMAALGVAAREIRPDVVLEISPHMALTPAVRHCLAGQDRPPACVRTLARDEDPRLSFHQALGALYRAGVPLDFAARYPRPRPASHLLPPHPKDERPLAGPAALPGPCQEDLELLRSTIRELAGSRAGGQPVPADQFGAVFLTGATGFAGRFVLSELLKRSEHMLVHCLVRAPNAKQALVRVQDALESAGRWDDFLGDRIRAWPGDLREPRFGLPELDFRRLCDQVDAVYHLAAERDLLSPYAALRATSTRGARTALELALRRRPKHLIYASAMEVFPPYFCDFAGDFAGQAIGDSEQPDPDLMMSVFPPDMTGYPWSKLVVEQALLSARAAGLPVAIMRLPRMGVAAGTGFTGSSDIKVRIAMAALDAGVRPSGFRLQWTEPVDTVSELLTAISLNPKRRHTVYHLCNPAPQTWGLELADFGFDLREVSYAEFKRACQARGPRSPLHGHWPLVDRFAGYWFPAGPRARPAGLVSAGPVPARAVESDAPDRPAWPGLVTMMARSSSWIGRQASWPYRRPSASADADALHRRAERIARRLDVPFGDAYPPELLEGLARLTGALRAPEARIRADRLAAISFELGRKLTNRAALAREYASEPAIAREPVEQPVFILGINRAGTAFLHRLLAQGPRFWAPYPDELAHPALPSAALSSGTLLGETGRRQYAADVIAASGIAAAMEGFRPGEPEEDSALLEDSFAAWSYTLRYHVPEYASWLAGQDGAFAYGVHRRTMQHLSWQRGTRLGAAPRQWLLATPFHLAEPETLVATYPDAIFIQIHREPREDMPSWLALTETVRAIAARPGDPPATGAAQLDFMSRLLGRVARFRAAYPEIDRRFADVSYLGLTENPAGTVAEIYRHFGWVFDDETRARTERWQGRQPALGLGGRRLGEPGRRRSLARYGLTAPQVDAAFARYAEFVRENKVRLR
jgi:thioester reductase-like protein